MKYITLDTCVWLGLIKIDLHNDNNVFEEICYWIEGKHLTHIVPENIIREWDRNKVKKTVEIIKHIKSLNQNVISSFRGISDIVSAYQPDVVEEIITKRIERVDAIFKTHSEIAYENHDIYNDAIKRNFDCLAPNHTEDSFRDTVNIITLSHYLKAKGYTECYFSTINYSDFSAEKQRKHELHPQLEGVFKGVNLQYVFCDEEPFAGKLMFLLRPSLDNFQDFLKERKRLKEVELLEEMKTPVFENIESPDTDFLENIKHIDIIISKQAPTLFERNILKMLIQKHQSYNQYFLQNVGNNGMV
ncbi:MAG: DUF4935 domain-containing protein [Bacteroidetes bacterium]|nr:DUF4935 domain-containing protein [Bacteroidota bacterium]